MTLALLFPGQGSQYVGMASALVDEEPAAAAVFAEADSVLGFALSSLMHHGPEDHLTATQNAQPALLCHSVAALRVLGERAGRPSCAAGHSLGEFSAYVAAETLTFADALRAVRLRGELMFEAGQSRPGTMAAILGLDDEAVRAVCARVTQGVCVPANFNSPGQVVVSGDLSGVEEAIEHARKAGAKRAVGLNVSGAFHSPLMEPAAAGLRDFLDDIHFADPTFPVISNVTAQPVTTGARARELLVRQLTSPVRWAESVAAIQAFGVDRFMEVGPGKVLSGLNRRNAKGSRCIAVGEPADFKGLEEA